MWVDYCSYHGLPFIKVFSKCRQNMHKEMFRRAEELTGKKYDHDRWFFVNKKGTKLYHEVKNKWFVK